MQKSKKQHSGSRQSRIYKLRNLIHAIKSQDEDYIDNVTSQNLNINNNYFDDGAPLHVAARIGNYKIFQKLIKMGADIHKQNPKTQETVLDSAMKSSNHDIVRYLKENGVEKFDRIKGETSLQFAAEEGTKEVMTLLLSNNVDINAKSVGKITPSSNAIGATNYDSMNALIKYVLDLFCTYKGDGDTKTIFHAALSFNNYTVLKNWLILFSRKLGLYNNNTINFPFFFCLYIIFYDALSIERRDENHFQYLHENNVIANIQNFIKRYIVELIAAGLYVSDRYITAVSNTKRFDDYSGECLLEVEKMKNNKIDGSNITFIEMLHKNVRYLAHCLKTVDLNKILTREPRFPEYPIYENKILFKLWKVQIRVNYLNNSEEVIYNIFYELQLPDTFIRELHFYLSNEDLKEIGQPFRQKKIANQYDAIN